MNVELKQEAWRSKRNECVLRRNIQRFVPRHIYIQLRDPSSGPFSYPGVVVQPPRIAYWWDKPKESGQKWIVKGSGMICFRIVPMDIAKSLGKE